jgi:hypothetical protein
MSVSRTIIQLKNSFTAKPHGVLTLQCDAAPQFFQTIGSHTGGAAHQNNSVYSGAPRCDAAAHHPFPPRLAVDKSRERCDAAPHLARWSAAFAVVSTIDLVLIDPQSVGKRTHDLMDTVNAKKR